ncbi:XdhC family protein [Natronolimnobius sp. AArcel1]|uniref:XdhC family protein n=1 Tax=Natronolimnobius sp. AArcel1 TaxID=1679093 RepID=UPI0013EBC401|nr:XdhC/CoxI family protein [Natronolimnobius sp. AArcel1]NGM70852.1 XdhC family protein [Natronolimnobius sp. AArcel1]
MTEFDRTEAGRSVHEALRDGVAGDREAVVATVVGVEGNAYRRPGAKMVVERDGTAVGQLTAGCLEDELAELADAVLEADEPRLETYDLTADDDVWGLGVGCNGIVDVLVEPLAASIEPLAAALEERAPIGIVTVLEGETNGHELSPGTRLYSRNGRVTAVDDASVPAWLIDAVREPATRCVANEATETVTLEADASEMDEADGEGSDEGGDGDAAGETDNMDKATVFIEGVQPPPRLVVLGSGHDVGPVVELGAQNGFRVEVIGFRGAIDLESRFPTADEHVSTAPAAVAAAIAPDERTYAVVMTHNFVDDRLALEALLESDAPYIGMMGPRERFTELLEAMNADGETVSELDLERVYAPIGVDLGAGSPYGIATSIISEVLAVHNDREPEHLTDREGPIHER